MTASITVRGLNESVRHRLRIRAAEHDRSMEAEIRAILEDVVTQSDKFSGLGTAIHQVFQQVESDSGDVFVELRSKDLQRAVDFEL